MQGFFLQKSVYIADRAATEARDAIVAAQTGANAAEEANKINREILIATNRPWITVTLAMRQGKPLMFTVDKIIAYIEVTVKNIGRSPATGVGFIVELYPDSVAANRRINNINLIDVVGAVTGLGRMLVPDDEFSATREVDTSLEDFKRAIREGALMEIDNGEPFDQGWPTVVATVWYKIPADPIPKYTVAVGDILNTLPGQIGFNGTEGEFCEIKIADSFQQ